MAKTGWTRTKPTEPGEYEVRLRPTFQSRATVRRVGRGFRVEVFPYGPGPLSNLSDEYEWRKAK